MSGPNELRKLTTKEASVWPMAQNTSVY